MPVLCIPSSSLEMGVNFFFFSILGICLLGVASEVEGVIFKPFQFISKI